MVRSSWRRRRSRKRGRGENGKAIGSRQNLRKIERSRTMFARLLGRLEVNRVLRINRNSKPGTSKIGNEMAKPHGIWVRRIKKEFLIGGKFN